MSAHKSVLIVDDDPMHQRIYGWIIQDAGYRVVCAEVSVDRVNLPTEHADLVLLDYRLGKQHRAVQIAGQIKTNLPGTPIVVLSEALELPSDIAPLVQGFVRKGDPPSLIATIHQFLKPPKSHRVTSQNY